MPLEKSGAIFLTRMPHVVSIIYSLSFAEASLCRIVGRLGERKRKRVCSHRPPRALCFSIIAIFIGIPSVSLCGGESYLLQSLKVLYNVT